MAERYGGAAGRASAPVAGYSWRIEHPTYGLVAAGLGTALTVLGFAVFDWAIDTSFGDVRRIVDLHRTGYSLLTQVYVGFGFVPVAFMTIAGGACAAAGRTAARMVVAATGVLGGVALVATVVWVASGAPGPAESRNDSALALIVTAGIGVVGIGAGLAAYADHRARLARWLVAALAAGAGVVHCYAVTDAFAGPLQPEFGAWAPALGYGLLALAPVLPYRRTDHG